MKKIILSILLLFHLLLLVNLKFTDWPEMFSFPYLFNNGYGLYKDMIHIYPPFLTLTLSFFYRIFGLGITQLKIFTWIFVLISDIVFYFLAEKIFKNKLPLVLTFLYIILSSFLDGNMLWFDTALVLPLLLASYFYIKSFKTSQKKNIILSGLFVGIACLTKQSAVFYLFTFSFLILKHKKTRKFLKNFLVSPFMLGSSFLLYLLISKNLKWFYTWALYFPLKFWSSFPSYVDFALPIHESRVLVYLGILLLPIIFTFKKVKSNYFGDILLIFVATLFATYPRLSFFHLQPSIPFYILILGYIYTNIKWKKAFVSIVLATFIAVSFSLVNLQWGKGDRFINLLNEEVISNIKDEKGKVLLLGPFSSYHPFTNTFPPKPWVDNYGWYWEMPGVQDEVFDAYKRQNIQTVIVRTPAKGNWYDLGVYLPQDVYGWVKSNYVKSEEIENLEIWKKE